MKKAVKRAMMNNKKPQFFQFRLPDEYFNMDESDQKEWIAEYLKTNIGKKMMLEQQKEENNSSND